MISVEKAKTFDLWTTISTADFKSESAKIGENFTGDSSGPETRKPLPEQGFDADCQNMSEVHPRGFEPLTFGSVDQTSFPFAFRMLVKTPLFAGFSFAPSFYQPSLKCRFRALVGGLMGGHFLTYLVETIAFKNNGWQSRKNGL